jgi:predicted ATP-binding protein involved in virulence
MKLNDIAFLNFRRFNGMHRIFFHPRLTVFAANNGAGKTSILDAIALAFGAFLTRLPKISGSNLADKDIAINHNPDEPFMIITANVQFDVEQSAKWYRIRSAPGRTLDRKIAKEIAEQRAPSGLKEINAYADYLSSHVESEVVFPILAYYGTGRAILDIPQRRRGFGKDFPRFQSYWDCLNPRTNFKKLFEYFYFLEDLERREKVEMSNLKHENGQLCAIRAAICSFLQDKYTNPRTALRPLRFLLDDSTDGISYSIDQLSDGYKTSLAMVMDIACRAVEANPHLGEEALNVPGIVLIDEIELHLHPSWQQRIIPDLQRTFPNVQFICTTHSPQVLSTVPSECIRTVGEDGRITEPNCKTYGAESKRILEELMGVNSRPPVHKKELREFIRITDAGDWTSARYQELRALLVHDLGETDPVIIEADIKKNFQELEVE